MSDTTGHYISGYYPAGRADPGAHVPGSVAVCVNCETYLWLGESDDHDIVFDGQRWLHFFPIHPQPGQQVDLRWECRCDGLIQPPPVGCPKPGTVTTHPLFASLFTTQEGTHR